MSRRTKRTASAQTEPRRAPKRRSRVAGRRKLWLLGGLLAFASALVLLVCLWLWGGDEGGETNGSYVRIVLEDTQPDAVAELLAERGLISDVAAFHWYQRVFLPNAVFERGPHFVKVNSSPRELVALLARHLSRPVRKVLVPEGFDAFQIAARLEQQGICASQDFLAAAFDAAQAEAELGAASYEGYLYPATYELRLNTDATEVRRRMSAEAQARFRALFEASREQTRRWKGELGLELHELVVLASVVQKETSRVDEMGTVASVFKNRLSSDSFRPKGMLQSDPTAGYGCKLPDAPASCRGFSGTITRELLRDVENRYNTYKHPGLPPGPVCNPGVEVLRAVLSVPATEYFYFYATSGGRHVFSRTFDEHRAAISGAPPSR